MYTNLLKAMGEKEITTSQLAAYITTQTSSNMSELELCTRIICGALDAGTALQIHENYFEGYEFKELFKED